MRQLIVFLSLFFCLFAENEKSLKQEINHFLQTLLRNKINTTTFNVVIDALPNTLNSDNLELNEQAVEDLQIPPQQRSFELKLILKNKQTCRITGKIEWLANIPVVLRPIGASDTINASDIGILIYPLDQLTPNMVINAEELLGKTAANMIIKPSMPIEKTFLKNPLIIKRGDVVEVGYRGKNLLVTAKATALQDLALGDTGTFSLINNSTNHQTSVKRVTAKVIWPSYAEVVHG